MYRDLFELLVSPQIFGNEIMNAGKQLTYNSEYQQPGDRNECGNGGGQKGAAVVQQHSPGIEGTCQMYRDRISDISIKVDSASVSYHRKETL